MSSAFVVLAPRNLEVPFAIPNRGFSRSSLYTFRLRSRYLAVLATFFSPLGRGLMWILGLNAKSPLSTFVVGASLDVVMLAIIIVVGAVSLDCCLLFM